MMISVGRSNMSPRFNFPGTPAGPVTPMVYVKDKTVWQYKAPTRNLSKEEAPNEERGHQRGRMNFNCRTTSQIKNDHALFASPAGHSTCSDVFCSRVCGIGN